LQAGRALILSKNVRSLQVAQEMQLRLRQLRFHSFLLHIDPSPAHRRTVEEDRRQFEEALRKAEELAVLPREQRLVEAVGAGYQRELGASGAEPRPTSPAALVRWADTHPVRHLLVPCKELLRVNMNEMQATAQKTQEVGEQVRGLLVLLGVLGPVAGLVSGAGV